MIQPNNTVELNRSLKPFALLFLTTGAALVAHIITGIMLIGLAALGLSVACVVSTLIWRRSTGRDRTALRRYLRVGMIAGLLATGAYDLSRYVLIEVLGFTFSPFDIFSLFGQALLGAHRTGLLVTAAGVSFHLANGVGFAIAYTVWFGRRGLVAGIAWALALELLMVTFYPGWLGLKALDEFLQVSIVGHLAYGSALGSLARWLILREEESSNAKPELGNKTEKSL